MFFLGVVAATKHVAADVAATHVDGLQAGEGRVFGDAAVAAAKHMAFHCAINDGRHTFLRHIAGVASGIDGAVCGAAVDEDIGMARDLTRFGIVGRCSAVEVGTHA